MHKTIGNKICRELGLNEKNSFIFVDGCIGPDSHCDFPHDLTKQKKALSKIDKARSLHFLNDEYAYGEIGNALHYIQDIWVNQNNSTENDLLNDDRLLELIENTELPTQIQEDYKQLASELLTIERSGIEEWFNHSWGIWHKDYASCVFVFADIIEFMLPTLAPSIAGKGKEKLEEYVNSEAFEKAAKEGFLASTITNYCYPKLSGYSAAIYSLASLKPPSTNENTEKINLNIVYRLSTELAKYTVSPSTNFTFEDGWTNKEKDHSLLAFIMPEYHVLIKHPIDDVQKQRNLSFHWDVKEFTENWSNIKQELSKLDNGCENWRIILSGLVRMLS
jgi:hypothetical protein